MKNTLLCTLLVMLFALVGCEEFESLGFGKVEVEKKTDWNEVCATARVGNSDFHIKSLGEIDKQAGIYGAAWKDCNAYPAEPAERERTCGTLNNYELGISERYDWFVVNKANMFCNTVLGQNEKWQEF